MWNLGQLFLGLAREFLENAHVFTELVSESPSSLHSVTNGLEGLQAGPLLIERCIFALPVDPVDNFLALGLELFANGRVNEVLVISVLFHAVFHVVCVRFKLIFSLFKVQNQTILLVEFLF